MKKRTKIAFFLIQPFYKGLFLLYVTDLTHQSLKKGAFIATANNNAKVFEKSPLQLDRTATRWQKIVVLIIQSSIIR